MISAHSGLAQALPFMSAAHMAARDWSANTLLMMEISGADSEKYRLVITSKPTAFIEAYSAAGEMGFGWWLVEHYLSYHVNCPNSCGLGEPTRGRKDPPYFQMGYGSLDHIPDLVDPLVESPLPA